MDQSVKTDRCLTNLQILIDKVGLENNRQLLKWGIQTREPAEWLMYTTEELGEVAKAISENYYRDGSREGVVKEAIQTATLCLKIAEMYLD